MLAARKATMFEENQANKESSALPSDEALQSTHPYAFEENTRIAMCNGPLHDTSINISSLHTLEVNTPTLGDGDTIFHPYGPAHLDALDSTSPAVNSFGYPLYNHFNFNPPSPSLTIPLSIGLVSHYQSHHRGLSTALFYPTTLIPASDERGPVRQQIPNGLSQPRYAITYPPTTPSSIVERVNLMNLSTYLGYNTSLTDIDMGVSQGLN